MTTPLQNQNYQKYAKRSSHHVFTNIKVMAVALTTASFLIFSVVADAADSSISGTSSARPIESGTSSSQGTAPRLSGTSSTTGNINSDPSTRSDYGTGMSNTAAGYVDPTGSENNRVPAGTKPGYVDPTGSDNTSSEGAGSDNTSSEGAVEGAVNPTSTTLPSAGTSGSPRSDLYDIRDNSSSTGGGAYIDRDRNGQDDNGTNGRMWNGSGKVNPATGEINR